MATTTDTKNYKFNHSMYEIIQVCYMAEFIGL